MKNLLTTALLLLSFSSNAEQYKPTPIDGTQMKCFKESFPVEWSFCLTTVPSSKNLDIIYHLHGRNGNATWWNDKTYHTGKVHQHWLNNEKAPPVVASISFGKLWLLVDTEDEQNLLNIFTEFVIPKVESKLTHSVHNRSLFGISMGAVNSLIASLKRPSMFTKAAILCSPLPPLSHHSSFAELSSYYKRSSLSLKRALMKYAFSWKFFPSKRIWDLNNPLELIKTANVDTLPSYYISCGKKDDWDCMEGSLAVATALDALGGRVQWYPMPGGHCDIDHKSLAKFLVP